MTVKASLAFMLDFGVNLWAECHSLRDLTESFRDLIGLFTSSCGLVSMSV